LNRPLVSTSANISGKKADFISPQEFQAKGTQASSIVKIFENGEVLKIR
jgi:tRNA A37 threonylcarbamoyladenosine synthetase subunit TsaC/SUA5/YrdC